MFLIIKNILKIYEIYLIHLRKFLIFKLIIMSFGQLLPHRLHSNYKSILTSNLIKNKVIDQTNLGILQTLLNESQANTDEECIIQKTIQFMYRQNTSSFYKFLVKNKMAHVVLWTEPKCIIRHLGLQGQVYIQRNQEEKIYEACFHKNFLNRQFQSFKNDKSEHTSINRIVAEVNEQATEQATVSLEKPVAVNATFIHPVVKLEKTVPINIPTLEPKTEPRSWSSIAQTKSI